MRLTSFLIGVTLAGCIGTPVANHAAKGFVPYSWVNGYSYKMPQTSDDLTFLIDAVNIDTIEEVNTFVNKGFEYRSEEGDIWHSPLEFFQMGYGDCDEFAIAKYDLLTQLGYQPKLLIVFHKELKQAHLIVVVEGLVLDNNFDYPVPVDDPVLDQYKTVAEIRRHP